MKIGITFDLKPAEPPGVDVPDDAFEEYDSVETIEAIAGALRRLGHVVTLLGDGREFIEKVLADRPELVFNFAEGQGISRSREARVPAVLEMLGIPYTGSDPFTLAVTLDKDAGKKLAAAAGVVVPASFALTPDTPLSSIPELTYPLLIKPAWEGSSKGIRNRCIVNSRAEIAAIVEPMRQDHRQVILLEEYVEGDEITVGVFGNEKPAVIGIMRVLPTTPSKRFIYSLEVKRNWRETISFECPARVPPTTLERIAQSALAAYRALGCRDIARADYRLRDGVPYFLEMNPIPGLNPVHSDLVILANLAGWTYERLIATIVDEAVKRRQAPA